MPYEHDVFLSHNSKDKPAVETIAKLLKQTYQVKCWLDKWNLVPGEAWQEALEEALDGCETVAVFVGPNTISPWENEEMCSAMAVHNEIGHGFKEEAYEKALEVKLNHLGIDVQRQLQLNVEYEGEQVAIF